MMRRTPITRSPFKRKNEVTSTSANTPKNIHSKTAQSHSKRAPDAIKSRVKSAKKRALNAVGCSESPKQYNLYERSSCLIRF